MGHIDFEKYARVIVRIGANVQKGQDVRMTAELDQAELVRAVVEECYKAGAKYVDVTWNYGPVNRLHYQYADAQTLGTVREWEEARAKEMAETLPVRIMIASADPDELRGISADVLSEVRRMRAKVLKPYRDRIDGRHQWLIVAAASPAWARKVFPQLPEDEAVRRLWDAILHCVYLDREEDPVEIWQAHSAACEARARWLNAQNFTHLTYESSNGTHFRVGLIPGAKWCGAGDVNHENGAYYVPNMPTEEIFTSPMRGNCEGTLVATKPLSWAGQLIEDFTVRFENGRVVSCSAKKGGEILEKMFHMDEGASMLGEVALVPKESPINQTGLLFLNTLFDENACCHMAVGQGFGEVLDGYLELSQDELLKRGVNDSLIHVDFMVGSDDLHIIGHRADGTTADVFTNGSWAESAGQ